LVKIQSPGKGLAALSLKKTSRPVKFISSTPILFSSDLARSLRYYTEFLGFERKWDWGSPPTFGGVGKDGVDLFFCENGQGNPGTWICILVSNVDEYYETIKGKGANIVSPPETMEWGFREMLVEDPDGHRIRFGHGVGQQREGKSGELPGSISIIERKPTADEYIRLASAIGWNAGKEEETAGKLLAAAIHGVVAVDSLSGIAVGSALVLGDQVSFYYIKDVMVHPDWQGMRIGTALMAALTNWIDATAPDQALVSLITGEGLSSFYRQFGFQPMYGMGRRIHRS
jgi:catechol 2,3-dioxygenase-like lactoylglutathione lyase family enzyme/GNAT superfamily N-acetyltransferase